jgi:hypothetical protein
MIKRIQDYRFANRYSSQSDAGCHKSRNGNSRNGLVANQADTKTFMARQVDANEVLRIVRLIRKDGPPNLAFLSNPMPGDIGRRYPQQTWSRFYSSDFHR